MQCTIHDKLIALGYWLSPDDSARDGAWIYRAMVAFFLHIADNNAPSSRTVNSWKEAGAHPHAANIRYINLFLTSEGEKRGRVYNQDWINLDFFDLISALDIKISAISRLIPGIDRAFSLIDGSTSIIRKKYKQYTSSYDGQNRELDRLCGSYSVYSFYSGTRGIVREILKIEKKTDADYECRYEAIGGDTMYGWPLLSRSTLYVHLIYEDSSAHFGAQYLVIHTVGANKPGSLLSGILSGITDRGNRPCACRMVLIRDENSKPLKIEPDNPLYEKLVDAVVNVVDFGGKDVLSTDNEFVAKVTGGGI